MINTLKAILLTLFMSLVASAENESILWYTQPAKRWEADCRNLSETIEPLTVSLNGQETDCRGQDEAILGFPTEAGISYDLGVK